MSYLTTAAPPEIELDTDTTEELKESDQHGHEERPIMYSPLGGGSSLLVAV